MIEEKYKEALETLENTMLLCDKELKPISPSNNRISKLKSEELNGVPIQWRLLRAEVLIMNNDYYEALNVAEIIINSPGNSKNSEANSLKTKLKYKEAIQKYDELIKEYKEIYLTRITLVILLINKCSYLIKV